MPDAYRDPSIVADCAAGSNCTGRQTIQAMIFMVDQGVANVTRALSRQRMSVVFIGAGLAEREAGREVGREVS